MPSTTQKTSGLPSSTQKNRQLIFVSKKLSHEQSVQKDIDICHDHKCMHIHSSNTTF
jgi:hypothetical protein